MLRQNQNPNVRRVRKMQEEEPKPRVGRPIRPTFHKTRPQHSERAWRGDITGRKIRAGSSDKLRPRAGEEPANGARISPRPRARRYGVVPPSVSGRARKIFSGKSFYVNNQSYKPPRFQSERSRMALSMLKRYNNRRKPGDSGPKIVPRSASAAYMARRSTNVWAHFPRPKRKVKAITTDLAGKRLRTKNFETQRPVLTNPTWRYQKRSATGERAYKGPAAGGYMTRTRSGRAWKGDIAHRAIRGGFRSKKGEPKPGSPIFGRGTSRDDMRMGRYQGNLRGGRRTFDDQGEEYSGNIRFRKPEKGGGSVSGGWNNKGLPIRGRTPGKDAGRIGYSGNIKAGRRAFNDQGEEYTGNIKFRKPEKGGGSRSGGHWNNNQTPVLVRTPRDKSAIGYQGDIKVGSRDFQDQGEEYSGAIKTRRPEKGGGSVSGKLWNNNGKPVEGRAYAGQTRISRYAGNIKARRPEKGGGSVSGKLWNNEERPIEGKAYSDQTRISRYAGNVKAKRPEKGGGSISGELWNNDEKPVEGKSYVGLTRLSRHTGNVKISRGDYKRNPHSAEGALPGLKGSEGYTKAAQHTSGVRRDWDYIKNPSSADLAQRTREPGRAFGRSADFQGNIRVKKFDLFGKSDLHPDAQFVKLNKNNVAEEKDMLTNFKLWWARLFRKAETQPDHLKENDKDRKPRYDKGEAGLWYE